ncbi:MAG TPA: serine hydrolase [Ktedonobacter sp.]|jgi:CubicO group peptidase (beta-lactamase class C family)|nr:serine hydrolase [Ktedonobacter sp.]HBE25926.1 serine hydrolase [Ktedonobacter sp.]HCF86119.1 serine hydrolase [Ktedonobacter sp.]
MQLQESPKVTPQLQGFADFVHSTMQNWKVPGLAIAVVKGSEVIFSQGFGERDVEGSLKVTPQTLFPIASCTKAFTTTAMAILADEGKLDWDTPVKNYLPSFKLYDPFASEHTTPTDLVTHRSGLPRHDLMWYNSSYTRQELFDRLQYLEPNKDFRAVWQYQNLMYMVAGYLVGQIAGQTWEDFIQQRIFDRLGMSSSVFSTTTAQQTADFSFPYKEKNDEVKQIPFYEGQWSIAPAGAIVSNIADMTQWLLLHVNKGRYGETQIVSESQMTQMHAPHMVAPVTFPFTEIPIANYGLGWFVEPYRGYVMVEHGGNIDGFSSLVTLLPEHNIGVAVLTSLDGIPVPNILTYNICDRLLGLDEVAWSERFKRFWIAFKEAAEKGKEKTEADRVSDTHPSHPLAAFSGDYAHPGYGVISVQLEDDQLQGTYNSMAFPLKHYHYDIFEMVVEKFDVSMKVSFSTNVKGDISSLIAPLEPTVKDIVFKRLPSKELTDKSFLEQFTGQYDVMGMTMTIALKGEKALVVSLPMQPELELVPYKGTIFHVNGLSGYSIEFKRDDTGGVTEAIVEQPFGVVTATKKTAGS